jgi:hypothetical protein
MEELEEDKDGHFGGIECEETPAWTGQGYCSEKADFEISTNNPESPA